MSPFSRPKNSTCTRVYTVYFKFQLRDFLVFQISEIIRLSVKWTKKLGGHGTCLGDIVQIIAKMNIFCSFSRGSLGQVLHKLA